MSPDDSSDDEIPFVTDITKKRRNDHNITTEETPTKDPLGETRPSWSQSLSTAGILD
jgi:hypothetical protein